MFCTISLFGIEHALGTAQRGLQELSWTPKSTPGAAPEAPRAAQDPPSRLEEPPRRAKSGPRMPPEPPRFGFRAGLAASWCPPAAQELSECLQEAILDLHGTVFPPPGAHVERAATLRTASAQLSCGQGLYKHTASLARCPRVTSTCGLVRRRTRRSRSTNPILGQLDSILAWGDPGSASSGELRQPWEPLPGPYVP